MGRPKNTIPQYLRHSSGCARTCWTDAAGVRRIRSFPGAYNSPESKAALAAFLLELESSPSAHLTTKPAGITVAELLLAFADHAERHYRHPDGKPTSEIFEVRIVTRALRELYANTPVTEFGPLALKAARQVCINDGRSRTECNRRVGIVKRIFKWGVAEELVPASVHTALATVTGLQRGRTTAPETDPVGPVDDATVDATLPHVNRHVRGLIEFQRYTGCRPGEACSIRRCDIDTGGKVWLYRPVHHKTSWRGKSRIIAIGPEAQRVLKEFFTPDASNYVFSPARAMDEIRAERAAARVTPRYPSHMRRNAAKRKLTPQRKPAARYDTGSYALAVARAVARLNALKVTIPHWHPNQLRHTFATKARKQFSLEHAGASLGHSKVSATEIYAERDAGLAVEVAARIG
jgi:integrase